MSRIRSRLQSLSMDLGGSIEQAELRGFARNTSDVAFLLLVLVGVFFLLPGNLWLRPGLAMAAFVAFAAVSLALRFLPTFRRETRLKIVVQVFAMLAFTTAFLFSTSQQAPSLLILYLLPMIVSALTLGRWSTLAVTILSVIGYLLASLFRDPAGIPPGHELAELAIALAPFFLVAYVTAMLAHEIELARQRIHTLSETDELTGLFNLRAFSRLHRLEHERALRHQRRYSIIIMDLNALKQINDNHGHEAGDRALILFANVIARLIRATDAAARFGGDEYVVLLSETDGEQALRVSHRIRSAVERCTIEAGGIMVRLSVSVGAATYPDDAEDPRQLIICADEAMYRNKHDKRAKVSPDDARAPEMV